MAANRIHSFAFGIGTKNANGAWLEVYYPTPVFAPSAAITAALTETTGYSGGNVTIALDDTRIRKLTARLDDRRQIEILSRLLGSAQPRVICIIESDQAIASTPEAYLKLHLLSHRHIKPNSTNLDGIFESLPNIAWTNQGAIDLAELINAQLSARARGELLEVTSVDKFPRMANYVVPSGVRIADTARVRLGAYLGEGTTVMHEGFINFNAGAIGPNMVEGRLSQGVIMDSGSDLGGSASTMGTLSGGGSIVLSIGKDCLIGANAGTGIPLGDRCTIEAGLYVTAATPVQVLDKDKNPVKTVKARALAGQSNILFIRNSLSGQVECRTNLNAISLNQALHAHN